MLIGTHGRRRLRGARVLYTEESTEVWFADYGFDRTPLGFVVEQRAGSESDAEFSYRVVAKRRGFERLRLERAPWADSTAGFALH